MNVLKSNRLALLVLAGITVLGAVALVFLAPSLLLYFLIAMILVGVVWVGSYVLVGWLQRRRQQSFDASVAAKEGIEDRKSEWRTWTTELDQQGIDRYELPFYLLVGEPQSGKSVLLQNSDLNFPFGQTRLSGIGGTRGCDWWFTEEAVILDLAGRLFTHEGGASDEAEWEAFLELLAGYRPLCPADGVMLVIPCDSLLADNKDTIARKAGKIRDALLTLTGKLQAQLPIYVVLTKGDRIFGFAETVHRLDAEQRHQMFGWSRAAEEFEESFDIVEVRRAFDVLVERARGLRDSMMSTVRLPEGVAEVDRMYAFPDELSGIGSSLEAYLKGIFSESRLVDRLYFRGFYLTSGLQSGKPIANICSELFGGAGEADQRDLEALFTRQHAYFIKDLVRRRVFSERGLVRPTAARVSRAKRNAMFGYGAAASLALVSTVWCAVYALTEYEAGVEGAYDVSIRSAAAVANADRAEVSDLLGALDRAWKAIEVEGPVLEDVASSRDFETLYCELYDLKLGPRIREVAEAELAAIVRREQAVAEGAELLDHAGFRRRLQQLTVLLGDVRLTDPDVLQQFTDLLEAGEFQAGGMPRLLEACARRSGLPGAESVVSPASSSGLVEGRSGDLAAAVAWFESAMPRTLRAGDRLQVGGAAGYLVAWNAASVGSERLGGLEGQPVDVDTLEAWCRDLHPALSYLAGGEAVEGLSKDGDQRVLPRRAIRDELEALESERAGFLAAAGGTESAPWPRRAELAAFANEEVGAVGGVIDGVGEATGLSEGKAVNVPSPALADLLTTSFRAVCEPAVLGRDALERPVELANTCSSLAKQAVDAPDLARTVLRARCKALEPLYLRRFGAWEGLASLIDKNQGASDRPQNERPGRVMVPGLQHLMQLHIALRQLQLENGGVGSFDRWLERLRTMFGDALRVATAVAPQLLVEEGTGSNAALVKILALATAAEDDGLKTGAARLQREHADAVHQQLLVRWRQAEAEGSVSAAAYRMVSDLGARVAEIRAELQEEGVQDLLHDWLNGEVETRLLGLVDAQREGLEAQVRSALPSENAAVYDYARDIEDALERDAISEWQGQLDGPEFLHAEQMQEGLRALQSLDEAWGIRRAAQLLEAASTRLSGADLGRLARAGGSAAELGLLVKAMNSRPESQEGPLLAKALGELQSSEVAVLGDGPFAFPDVAEWYVGFLRAQMEVRARQAVRELYLQDLERAWKAAEDLRDAVGVKASGLPGLRSSRSGIAEDLRQFFGPQGRFADLQSRYLVDTLSFKPADLPPGDVRARFWSFDRAMVSLAAILRPHLDPETEEDATFEFRLVAQNIEDAFFEDRIYVHLSPAKDPRRAYLDTTQDREGRFAWRFGANGSERFSMRWSKSPRKDGRQDSDAELAVDSPLAPMLLVWVFGEPVDTGVEATDVYDVEAPLTALDGSKGASRLRVRFDQPVPMRPQDPWRN